MATTIIEHYASQETVTGRNPSAKLMFKGKGSELEKIVRPDFLEYLAANFPDYEGLSLVSTTQRHMGTGIWELQADYGLGVNESPNDPGQGGTGSDTSNDNKEAKPEDPIGPYWSVSITARQQHVTQALFTVDSAKKFLDGRPLPLADGVIGESADGVEGCDIQVPSMAWTESWKFSSAFVTFAYIDQLADLVGRTNNAKFRNAPAGEVMFMGAELDPEGTRFMKMVFHFVRERNVTGFRLTPEFDPVDKKGHQYLDVRYETKVVAGKQRQVPYLVHVHEVGRPGLYTSGDVPTNEANFLKIGVGS